MKSTHRRKIQLRKLLLGYGTESRFPTGLVLISLIFPLVAWMVEFILRNHEFTFYGFLEMHKTSPLVFLIDIIPIVAGIVGYKLEGWLENMETYYEHSIEDKKSIIQRNAYFAKQIGEGKLDIDQNAFDENDLLGQSLIRMRDNLLKTSQKESERSWITAGKDKIATILRLHNDLDELAYDTLVNLIEYIKVVQGAFYIYDEDEKIIENRATYAYNRRKYVNQRFKIGEGLVGQAAFEMDIIYRKEIPEDYLSITSGLLKEQKPNTILVVPLITDEKLQGVLEFASLEKDITPLTINFLKELSDVIARTLFNLKVNKRTEKLLQDSQKMTEELKENEEELRQNAEEMRATHEELERSNAKLEQQITEVENAQKRLHSLLENASEVISIYDQELNLKYISPSVANIYGFTPDEMIDGKDMDRLTAKGTKEIQQMFKRLLDDPSETIVIQYTYMNKAGKKIYVETTGRNLLNDEAIAGIILNSQDITERKRAEKEERMKSKMQALSENSPDMIMRMNEEGQFFYANPIVKIFTGVDNKTIVTRKLHEVEFNDEIKNFFTEAIKDTVESGQKQNYETVFPTNFGETIMQVSTIPEFNEENELETILFVAHDITEQKKIENEIKEKNKNITESINYAERIQKSLLPSTIHIQEFLPKSFIFYRPRDVVSGDFPWFFQKDDYIYIAAVDCTGHGVPGALLSFIGYFILNNVVDHDDGINAGKILDRFHLGVRSALKQDKAGANARDGMDIAFCKINLKTNQLDYAGAHRPLYLLRNNELFEYKGNRKAIGGIPLGKKPEKDFKNYELQMEKGDKIFFFSDGLPDQVGGPNKRKYQPKRIREHLKENAELSMAQYNDFSNKDFLKWKGDNKQIDDVLLIGIEF